MKKTVTGFCFSLLGLGTILTVLVSAMPYADKLTSYTRNAKVWTAVTEFGLAPMVVIGGALLAIGVAVLIWALFDRSK